MQRWVGKLDGHVPSLLEWIGPEKPVRYLGMEMMCLRDDEKVVYHVHQQAYIMDLFGAHGETKENQG